MPLLSPPPSRGASNIRSFLAEGERELGAIEQVGLGLVVLLLGGVGGWVFEQLRQRYRYRALRTVLRGRNRLQIAVSSIELESFTFKQGGAVIVHNNPPNVLFLPLPEGRAIARLVHLLRDVQPTAVIEVISGTQVSPKDPVFSVGGPSVNLFSGEVLLNDFPQFRIDYPDARAAHFDGLSFDEVRLPDNSVTRDCGFILISKSSESAPIFVLCGITAFGTAAAVDWLAHMRGRSDAIDLVSHGAKGFIALAADVTGYNNAGHSVVSCRKL